MAQSFWFDGFTDEQIETIRAFAHAIQNRSIDDIEFRSGLTTWKRKPIPTFEIDTAYRVKPQPKIVPFDYSDAEMLINKVVKTKEFDRVRSIVALGNDNLLKLGDMWITYLELFDKYTFLDGSPCGKVGE